MPFRSTHNIIAIFSLFPDNFSTCTHTVLRARTLNLRESILYGYGGSMCVSSHVVKHSMDHIFHPQCGRRNEDILLRGAIRHQIFRTGAHSSAITESVILIVLHEKNGFYSHLIKHVKNCQWKKQFFYRKKIRNSLIFVNLSYYFQNVQLPHEVETIQILVNRDCTMTFRKPNRMTHAWPQSLTYLKLNSR